MLHIVESTKPLERLASDLAQAVVNHKFGVLGVHDLKQTMAKKGVAFARECRIFEVCNPHQAKKVLEANLAISTAQLDTTAGRTWRPLRDTAIAAQILYAAPHEDRRRGLQRDHPRHRQGQDADRHHHP